MFFFDMCNAVAAREDRKTKYWRLGRRHLGLSLTLWRHTVKHDILNTTCDCWFPRSCVYWSLVKTRKIIWESHVIDSSSIAQSEALWVWRCEFWLGDYAPSVNNQLSYHGWGNKPILNYYYYHLIFFTADDLNAGLKWTVLTEAWSHFP